MRQGARGVTIDADDLAQHAKIRIEIYERLVRVESRVCAISADLQKQMRLSEELVSVLHGITALGKGVIGLGAVVGAGALIWAAVVFIVRQASG
jgi:hypothetical protein